MQNSVGFVGSLVKGPVQALINMAVTVIIGLLVLVTVYLLGRWIVTKHFGKQRQGDSNQDSDLYRSHTKSMERTGPIVDPQPNPVSTSQRALPPPLCRSQETTLTIENPAYVQPIPGWN